MESTIQTVRFGSCVVELSNDSDLTTVVILEDGTEVASGQVDCYLLLTLFLAQHDIDFSPESQADYEFRQAWNAAQI